MAHDKWWRRQDRDRGQYAPHLWPVWLVAPIWVAAAIALGVVIYLQLRAFTVPHAVPNGGPAPQDPLDVIKTTITVAGFVGAVLVGVYGYRKQRLVEGDARRADAEQLAQRYTTAADQLGHDKAAVRLAGVYAMARLADDWDEQRQVCIDVLCAYLRMPYEPDTASEKHREGEREVRHTIIRLIRDHLQDPTAPTAWCSRDLDFTNATFDGGDFTGAKFTGDKVSFDHAKFTDGHISFDHAEFASGVVFFGGAEFSRGSVSFDHAKFAGGIAFFECAQFAGGNVSFDDARFTGGDVSFGHAEFASGEVSFGGAEFASGDLFFNGAKFTGSIVYLNAEFTGGEFYFHGAKFTGGAVSFEGAEFAGGAVSFDGVEYIGGNVSFDDVTFATGCRIAWGPFEPPATWSALPECERLQNESPL
jgi:uncharacterized protein YjbI with pentapeptide repeats